jgi:class 3 adenylate cyclase
MAEREMLDRQADLGSRMAPAIEQALLAIYHGQQEHTWRQSLAEHVEDALERAGLHRRMRHPPAICFLDITGYTRLTEERGDAAAADVAARLTRLVERSSQEHGGRPVKWLGDGVMFYFREPGGAVLAALEMVEGAARHDLPPAHVGVHAGPVVFQEGDYFGRTVNRAAGLTSATAIATSFLGGLALAGEISPGNELEGWSWVAISLFSLIILLNMVIVAPWWSWTFETSPEVLVKSVENGQADAAQLARDLALYFEGYWEDNQRKLGSPHRPKNRHQGRLRRTLLGRSFRIPESPLGVAAALLSGRLPAGRSPPDTWSSLDLGEERVEDHGEPQGDDKVVVVAGRSLSMYGPGGRPDLEDLQLFRQGPRSGFPTDCGLCAPERGADVVELPLGRRKLGP